MTNTFQISRLASGGLITNYHCSSQCAHCLYASGPRWPKEYISSKTTEQNIGTMLSLGCPSIHIGGGEPFLSRDGLITALGIAKKMGMPIDYVETNASWYKNEKTAGELLETLLNLDVTTILVSISPFHNAFIPFDKVKGVITACQVTGMSVLPWMADFAGDIQAFPGRVRHSLEEYQSVFGEDYLDRAMRRYHVHEGGRALQLAQDTTPLQPLSDILKHAAFPCRELANGEHYHLDLFEGYIPGFCTGLSIKREDLGRPLSQESYPISSLLYTHGIGALLEWTEERYQFKPSPRGYTSKCHLCHHLRWHLATTSGRDLEELRPGEYYNQISEVFERE